jgi:hypothetical protein
MLFAVCWVSLFALMPQCAGTVSFGGGCCDVAGVSGSLSVHGQQSVAVMVTHSAVTSM